MIPLHWPAGEHYDCVQCGRGCRSGWTISVEPEVVEKLQGHPLTLRVIQGAPFERAPDGGFQIHHGSDGTCGYLDDQNLCRVHAELGAVEKPTTCQQHPFHLLQTPDGVYVGLSYQCTSVRDGSGRPAEVHDEWLRGLMARGARVAVVDAERISLGAERCIQWGDYTSFETELVLRIASQGLDLSVQQALQMVAGTERDGGLLGSGWGEHALHSVPLDAGVEALLGLFPYTLLKLLMPGADAARVAALDVCFTEGLRLELPEFGWSGTWLELAAQVKLSVVPEWETEIERWIAMQLHRKALLVRRPLLFNLWALGLVPRMIRLLTCLHAGSHGRIHAQRSDYLLSLDWCECNLGCNGDLADRYGPAFSAALTRLLPPAA